MTKYVIDLPAAATVIVAKKRFLLNETDVMRVPVSQLELYVDQLLQKTHLSKSV